MILKRNPMEILIKLTLEDPQWFWYLKLRHKFLRREHFTVSNAKWYLYSGCSKHITADECLLSSFIPGKGWFVFYSDNNKGKNTSIATIGKFPNFMIVEVLLVDGLEHNLLSISQLCDKGNNVTLVFLDARSTLLTSW